MSRVLSYALFFGIVVCLCGLVHYYFWVRLIRDTSLPPWLHQVLTALLILFALSVPATFLLVGVLKPEQAKPILIGVYVWMGMVLLLLVPLLITDAARAAVWLVRRWVLDAPPVDPERRLTIARILAAGTTLVAATMGAFAIKGGLANVILREVRVRLDRLPRELDGTTIVQLTDVHIGPTIGREFLEGIVHQANTLDPDVIAITGDLVDGSVEQLREHVAPLARLKARYGVYFVTGNHEYYSGPDEWCAELERLGIRVLRNERVSIGNGQGSFDLAGVDDYHANRYGNGHGSDLARAVAGRDPDRELVLLAHQPRAVYEAVKHGVGLQLSGHTHGGQLWPWSLFVRLQQPVVSGLARFGRTLVYVSNGTGYWGPPMRLGAPAEVTKVVLSAGAQHASLV
jgi:hypothetical protein